MAEFLKGDKLNSVLAEIFEKAERHLLIISPFIKPHARIKEILNSKKQLDRLEIVIVFGKNEGAISKSFNLEEFEFFKDFPNIEIKYEPRLHAKYYANESSALLSSMNLYDYSQNNNIEFGISTKPNQLAELTGSILGDSLDKEALKYFSQVIQNSKTLYKRTPEYEETMMGLKKKYKGSKTEDRLSEKLGMRKEEVHLSIRKDNIDIDEPVGYCIRTGIKIPFNPQRPFCDKAYNSWARFQDENYQEKYCHYSGEESFGETSFSRPILRKNWKKSQAV